MEWVDCIKDAYISRKEVISGEEAIRCGLISLPLLSAFWRILSRSRKHLFYRIDRLRLACRLEI
jgi:hypothetical protein